MTSGLITPNFSSDSLGKHTDYVEQLSRKHATLSKLDLEEPLEEADGGRILALRERVQEAWSRAEGNPASGKWISITRLLRMGITSGRGGKWLGARADVEPPKSASGWISTMSEADWMEWEQKFIQDQRVETWKKGVEVIKPRTTSQIVSIPKDLQRGSSRLQMGSGIVPERKLVPTASIDPLKDSSPFGFGVVKRTSQTNVLKGKPFASGNKMPSSAPGLPIVSEAPETSKEPEKRNIRLPKIQTISVVELSSRRPSFSGPQLVTSTPKQPAKPTKTSLVARREVSSPLTPLISSPSKRTLLGRASSLASQTGKNDVVRSNRGVANSFSAPVISSPESPLRHTTSQHSDSDRHDLMNTNNKRTLSSSHSYPAAEADSRMAKKAKTISSDKPAPETPPRRQGPTAVPTLTELLASAKKAKKKRPQRKEMQHSTSGPAQASGDGEENPPFFDPYPADDGGGGIQDHASETRRRDSRLNDFHADLGEEEAVGRSIIGDEYVLDSPFRPLATSTQVQADHDRRRSFEFKITQPDDPRPVGNVTDSWESIYAPHHGGDPSPKLSSTTSSAKDKDSLFPQLSYNTQFESAIAAQAEKVDKLLQRDVDYGLLLTPVKDRERDEESDGLGSPFE